MCILCAVQRWSRRVATMLPRLVIPLIVLWALSQLLPPGLRFEITSPRLACVLVLLATLFWYEVLMPQISVWRARRSARLRERRRVQAIELQKLCRTATRRCRNCHAPYRDQNPGGGGRFMCSYCGHVSKRPVLGIPGPPSGGSGIVGDLVEKNSWICSQDWSPDSAGNWAGSATRYWVGSGSGDDRCSTERSYSGVFVFACRLLSGFFFSTRWLWRKVFRAGSSREDSSLDAEHKGLTSRKRENEDSFQESRGEKARRKAEEKRQARLEREILEEEEKKQREEVARLVEERRRVRDEKLEVEKQCSKGSASSGERGGRKETEKRRQERRKEKDKGSSKSNSDGEELEKSASRESERKREFDNRTEHERCGSQNTMVEKNKLHASEPGHGSKVTTSKTKYFDHMKGTFLSSSRGFNGASFFGRNASPVVSATKTSKPAVGFVDHRQSHGNVRDAHSTGHVIGKSAQNGDHQPMGSDVQPRTTVLKKSWHQLFTRTSSVSLYPDTNSSSFANQSSQLEAGSAQSIEQKMFPNYSIDNQIGRSLPFTTYPSAICSFSSSSVARNAAESMYSPLVTEPGQCTISEEAELFEDPCYVPDSISLLGPISESLDNFSLDLGAGFITNDKMKVPRALRNVSASADMNKPSPIESPMSRLRGSEERRTASGQVTCTPKLQKTHTSNLDDSSSTHEQGTWQMWGTPLAQDGLGLIGCPSSWFSPLEQNKTIQEDAVLPLSHNPMISQLAKENSILPAIRSPQSVCVGNHQNGGTFSPLGRGLNGSDLCIQNTPFQPLPVDGESHFLPHNLIDNIAGNEVTYESPDSSADGHPFELSPANCWSMGERVVNGPKDAGNLTFARPHVGGLFPTEQSLWSFN